MREKVERVNEAVREKIERVNKVVRERGEREDLNGNATFVRDKNVF